ncbi:MAG: hypothetical protein M1834_004990 [Cirrosporium novae-zelandiae]|nr:MAG: hypothetical protein M1834_004990 [Cirrosporium novae-zelandiae]
MTEQNPWETPVVLCFGKLLTYICWWNRADVSLDGGGIKGYSSLLILRSLMERINALERSGNYGDTHNSSYCPFDQEVDVNHLISLMLGRLRMSVDQCLIQFRELGGEVFGTPRIVHGQFITGRAKYSQKKLEKCVETVAKNYLPESDRELNSPIRMQAPRDLCKSVLVACRQKDGQYKPYLFRTYVQPRRHKHHNNSILVLNPGEGYDVRISEAAAATAAAPFYFTPKMVQGTFFIDGGFGNNNPGGVACDDVAAMIGGRAGGHPYRQIRLFISIGTGKRDLVQDSPSESWLPILNMWKLTTFMKRMVSSSDDKGTRKILSSHGVPYYRFNVQQGMGCVSLDQWNERRNGSPSTLEYIETQTIIELNNTDVRAMLDECAEALVSLRRARIHVDSSRWERYTRCGMFYCDIPGCSKWEKEYTSRTSFRRHVSHHHTMGNDKEFDEFVDKCRHEWNGE